MAVLPSLAIFIGLAWPSAAEVNEAKDAVYKAESYQREMPETKARKPRDPQRRRADPGDVDDLDDDRISASGSGPASVLVWVIIGLIVLGGLAVTAREWTARRRGAVAGPESEGLQPAPVAHIHRDVLSEAERLAAEGRFGDAVHALLLKTFQSIGAQRALPASLTSREVLVRVELRDDARAALGELVSSVEVALFGGAHVSAEDYARCADSFRRVLNADGVEVRG